MKHKERMLTIRIEDSKAKKLRKISDDEICHVADLIREGIDNVLERRQTLNLSHRINFLTGKKPFYVDDLIRILNRMDGRLPVVFGILYENGNKGFFQDENLIFDIGENFSKEQELRILTKINTEYT